MEEEGFVKPKTPAKSEAELRTDGVAASQGAGTGSVSKKKEDKSPATKMNKVQVREKMKSGDMIKSEHTCWRIMKLLGSGGFGDVYLVKKENSEDTKEFALKTELTTGDKHLLRLKIELVVLESCEKFKSEEGKLSHFVQFIDRGITPKFKFVVMGLVGPSLEDIRRQYLLKNFSKGTAMQTAIQTLNAIRDLHSLGWLHRDIKPANFAVGLGDLESHIYILDFGIARRFVKPDSAGKVKIPRAKVKFLGTLRFASRACHNCIEQSRKDDLETWIYMVYDLFDDECGLPWKKVGKRSSVIEGKDKFFKNQVPKTVYRYVPADLRRVVTFIGKLQYYDLPDYDALHAAVIEISKVNNIALDEPLDWIGQLKKKKEIKNKKKFTVEEEEDEVPAGPPKESKEPTKESKEPTKESKEPAKE